MRISTRRLPSWPTAIWKQAGLAGRVRFEVADMRDCRRAEPQGAFLCNPPYGERLSDRRACETLYRGMGPMLRANPGWSLSAITSHPGFERCFAAALISAASAQPAA
ncbi:MAG: hypothetical protein ACLUHE_07450 [Christensenellales bacterium]